MKIANNIGLLGVWNGGPRFLGPRVGFQVSRRKTRAPILEKVDTGLGKPLACSNANSKPWVVSRKRWPSFLMVSIFSFFSQKVIGITRISKKTVLKLISIGTAFIFAGTLVITPAMAETLKFEGGTVDVKVQDNVTNWNVTGNPVWNVPEFNIPQGSTYNISGLGSGVSLALLANGGAASNIFGTMNLKNLDFILQNVSGINIGGSGLINVTHSNFIASTLPLNLTNTNFMTHDY